MDEMLLKESNIQFYILKKYTIMLIANEVFIALILKEAE